MATSEVKSRRLPACLSISVGLLWHNHPFPPSFSKPLLPSSSQIYLLGRIMAAIRHHENIARNRLAVRVEIVSQFKFCRVQTAGQLKQSICNHSG